MRIFAAGATGALGQQLVPAFAGGSQPARFARGLG